VENHGFATDAHLHWSDYQTQQMACGLKKTGAKFLAGG
jgi:hypothetical protein